jgi:hypothetical protein
MVSKFRMAAIVAIFHDRRERNHVVEEAGTKVRQGDLERKMHLKSLLVQQRDHFVRSEPAHLTKLASVPCAFDIVVHLYKRIPWVVVRLR